MVCCCPSCPAAYAVDNAVAFDSAVADIIAAFGFPWVADVIMVSVAASVPAAEYVLANVDVPQSPC
jgi:hypothetical protein